MLLRLLRRHVRFGMVVNKRHFLSIPRRPLVVLATGATLFNIPYASAYSSVTVLTQIPQPQSVKLYQYQVCPFCNKVKAFLEFHNIPYEIVEVNPLSKEEIKFSEYKSVPFALIDGVQVNGSSEIIEHLSKGTTFARAYNKDCDKWCSWVDDHLVHLLPPNIYGTPSEALTSFDYITTNSNFSTWQQLSIRYSGAAIMYMIGKRNKKKYNISDPRKELFEAMSLWTSEGLESKGVFHGGSEPDVADITVYGVLRSLDNKYKTWEDMKAAEFSKSDLFWKWYEKMDELAKAPVAPA